MKFQRSTVLFVAATVMCTAPWAFNAVQANGPPSGYGAAPSSYGGYRQYQQQHHPLQAQQQEGQWYNPVGQHNGYQQDSPTPTTESDQPDPEKAAVDDDEQPPLPEGWSEHYDPNSGQYYYFNSADGTTTWDRPFRDPVEAAEETEHGAPPTSPLSEHNDRSSVPGLDIASGTEQEQRQSYGLEDNASAEEVQNWGTQQQQQEEEVAPGWAAPTHRQSDWIRPNATDDGTPDRQETNKPALHLEEEGGTAKEDPQQQQPVLPASAGWGVLPKAADSHPPQTGAWGVQRPPVERPQQQQQQQLLPPQLRQQSPPSSYDGRWGMPRTPDGLAPPSPPNQGNQQEQQRPLLGVQPPSQQQQQQPSGQALPPRPQGQPQQAMRPPQQLQRPQQQQLPRQYPPQQVQSPYNQYNPGAPSGPYAAPGVGQYGGQYGPYGGPGAYGASPYQQQQQQQPEQQTTGQLVAQGLEEGSAVVREALSTTWRSLLGFGNRTKEAVESAREQVVSTAAVAGHTLSQRSSSIWEQAKSTVGSVFESNDPNSKGQQPYSLGGSGNQLPPAGPGRRPPPGYPGGPPQYPGQTFPPGHPGNRGIPPGYPGSIPPGRYGQQPRPNPGYSGPPVQQNPERQQQQQPPNRGYPPMQPRIDAPYPPMQQGQPRNPIQTKYGSHGPPQQQQGGGYPPRQLPPGQAPDQRRPPYAAPQPGGPGGPPPNQQQPKRDPWDHPGLMGDH